MKKIIFILGILIFNSCEWSATENYIIDNQTEYEISVNFTITEWIGAEPETFSVSILPQSIEFLHKIETIYAFLSNEEVDFLHEFDTIIVDVNDTIEISKNINNYLNWEYNRVNNRVSADNCHKFIIRESDLVIK